jgi:membrane fusion protein (multidrug efflux system)
MWILRRSMSGMRWVIVTVILAAVVLGIGHYWRNGAENGGPRAAISNEAPPTITIETAPVRLERVTRQIEAVGTLRSNEAVIIRPEMAGRITQVQFEEGQKVKRGAPLFRLDAAIAEAQLEQAKASLALSRSNYDRAHDLYRKEVGTQRARDEATAKLRVDEAALALAQATLDKMTILAPFDGIIGLRRVSPGDYVNPGQDLVNLENADSLKVDFRIPEIYALQLAVGQSVRITLDAIPNEAYEGKVYAIDPAHDPNGRAVILRARIGNPDGRLRSGMFGRVVLLIEDRQESIIVPETALVPVGEQHFIYRYADGKAVLTRVKIGQRRRGAVEILDGLARDAVIVTEGALKLRDGLPVRAVPAKAG